MSALREAFLDELRDLLDAELQLLKALPKMAAAAENDGLRAAFREHQGETADQVRRLGQVFEAFEELARGKRCKGMKGLIEEAQELIEEDEGDAALIAAAQKAEHYEIAAYGTLAAWAVALGQDQVVQILKEILDEEKATDKKLTVIAQTVVNSHDSLKDVEEDNKRKIRRNSPTPKRSHPQPRSRAHRSTRNQSVARQTSRTSEKRNVKASRSKRLRAAKSKK